ncbi:hypothetical protein GALMADRAFT_236753 [Galerina marginata CBS 339.88]|uniref:Uncharacterized protein n=1 Tax=Galerina marginata (strain CBS 339.88) TaxID=685588 RepID=A0A067TLR6_GALM3|nr:hypothetical protein GALMADRAFT_236753 [Galerina marginata CBS 339.88]
MSLLSPLYNLPNHVIKQQQYYQGSTKPLIMRGARAPIYVRAYTTLWVVGVASTIYAMTSLVKGK